jgi:hypothetical protein
MAEYGVDGSLLPGIDGEPDAADDSESIEPDQAPAPWYRNRVLLALWALALALLLTLIIYGLVELSRGGEGGGPATTTSSTTKTRSSTTSSTTTTTPSSSSEAPPPPPQTPEQTPEEAPPPANSTAPSEPPRHHHHFHLPHGFF